MNLPFQLGQKVRFRPHHPGDVWSVQPHWIHAISCMVTRDPQRKAVVFYTLSDSADMDGRDQRLTPYTREEQLQAWPEAQEHGPWQWAAYTPPADCALRAVVRTILRESLEAQPEGDPPL